ncbi:MAG: hypothetical protein JNM27_21115 [Leptospirales bacterium]|nr:hypothetical protein [Leptospirales bacterium]
MSLKDLISVFDEERNGYMEWHDGPTLFEVDYAFARLTPEEKVQASKIVAERIRVKYDPYLGRAAELLATEECKAALNDAMRGTSRRTEISGNLLAFGKNDDALAHLRSVISNNRLAWSYRIDSLVQLKILLKDRGNRPIAELLTPEMTEAILDAVVDEDYLVRYHAADTLLQALGEVEELPRHKELFGLVCGTPGREQADDQDRLGFAKAAELLKERLQKGF